MITGIVRSRDDAFHSLQGLKPRQSGHHVIKQDEIKSLSFKEGKGLLSAGNHPCGVAHAFDAPLEQLSIRRVIIDDQKFAALTDFAGDNRSVLPSSGYVFFLWTGFLFYAFFK